MNIREALIVTLDKFKVKSKSIADATGLSPSQLSHFRAGRRGLEADNLEKLIDALEPEARVYFCCLVAGKDISVYRKSFTIERYMESLESDEFAEGIASNVELLMEALPHLDRNIRADILSKIIDIFRTDGEKEPVFEARKQKVACR